MADGMDKAYELRERHARACPRCKTAPKNASPRECAFTGYAFSDDNWNCATMNTLRALVEQEGLRVYGEDESLGVIRCPDSIGGFLVLSWYKDRGRTSVAQFVSSMGVEPLTLTIADTVIEANTLP